MQTEAQTAMGSANHAPDGTPNSDKAQQRVAQSDRLCSHGAHRADSITPTVTDSQTGAQVVSGPACCATNRAKLCKHCDCNHDRLCKQGPRQ